MVPFPVLSNPMAAAASRAPLDLPVAPYGVPGDMFGGGGAGELLRGVQSEVDKTMIVDLAVAAMEELVRMAQLDEPLWSVAPPLDAAAAAMETLSEEEYARMFPRGLGPKQYGLRSEASRDSAVVIMTHANLVEILMDAVSSWLIFCQSVRYSCLNVF